MSHAGGLAALVARSSTAAAVGAPLPPLPGACAAALPVAVPMRRTSPAGWRQRPRGLEWHEGLDLVAGVGDPVYAVRPGRVALATQDGARGFRGYGRCVVIDHGPAMGGRTVFACYAHNDALTVSAGQVVAAGEQIARAGRSSGGAFPTMPAHVHIGCRWAKHDGSSPWPGPYPHPVRAPLALATVWVDPEIWLAFWGIVPASDARATSYVVIAGSAADCPRVPRSIIRRIATPLLTLDDDENATAAPHASGPVASSSSGTESSSPAAAVAIGFGVVAAGVAVVASRKGKSR